MSHRDRDSGERGHRDRDQYPPPAGTPHHSNAGSLTIHQPVASRVPGAIHSPGGLLANHGGSSVPLGAPSGPVNSFGAPVSGDANRPHQHNAQNASSQMFGVIAGHNGAPASSSGAPGPVFGGPLQQQEGGRQNQAVPFTSGGPGGQGGAAGGGGGGAGPAAMAGGGPPLPANASALQQGQQPILNVSCFIIHFSCAYC